ncbi:hypothetical protein EUGRSUZ_E03064 [Eucalyptus grandis]|uniref:Uncharacterized protein n=2 Tax=Eucalyptus grandis TaxID=71139 RepID=A0ACC3KZ44_EUCGR|nr:hypothetical protein EUGRSUZ_E03064 [Eucalyptus grandis]
MTGLWTLFGLRGLILLDSLIGTKLKSIVLEFKHPLLWATKLDQALSIRTTLEPFLLFSLSFNFFKFIFIHITRICA